MNANVFTDQGDCTLVERGFREKLAGPALRRCLKSPMFSALAQDIAKSDRLAVLERGDCLVNLLAARG